jgi:hypothetical protein
MIEREKNLERQQRPGRNNESNRGPEQNGTGDRPKSEPSHTRASRSRICGVGTDSRPHLCRKTRTKSNPGENVDSRTEKSSWKMKSCKQDTDGSTNKISKCLQTKKQADMHTHQHEREN